MKLLVSSNYLAQQLNKVDFHEVSAVRLEGKELQIFTNNGMVKVDCEVLKCDFPIVPQEHRRWDWVKKLVNQVNEQPIVLRIYRGYVEIAFQY